MTFGQSATAASWTNANSAVATVEGTVTLVRGNLGVPITVANNGIMQVTTTDAKVTISGTINNTSTGGGQGGIRIDNASASETSVLKIIGGGVINNTGLIVLTASAGVSGQAGLWNDSGTINNNAGGIIQAEVGDGSSARNIIGSLNNNGGTISVQYDLGYPGYTSAILNNTGSIDIASGKFMNFGSGAILNNNTGGSIFGPGTFSNSGTVNLNAGTISSQFSNSGSLIAGGSTSVNVVGLFTNGAGATVSIRDNTTLSFANNFTNNGTINLTNTVTNGSPQLQYEGNLTNASTGSINFLVGAGGGVRSIIYASSGLTLNNQGTVSIAASGSIDIGNGGITNNNAFTIAASATLDIHDDGDNSRLFTNAGTLTVNGILNMNGLTSPTAELLQAQVPSAWDRMAEMRGRIPTLARHPLRRALHPDA